MALPVDTTCTHSEATTIASWFAAVSMAGATDATGNEFALAMGCAP